MKWLRTVMTLMLAAFWLVAINHCKLEQIPGLSFLGCCDHEDAAPHQDNDCDTDGCAAVEDGLYKSEETQPGISVPVFVLAVSLVPSLDEHSQSLFSLPDFSALASPELAVTWQFFFRAAAPPRAPSLVS